MTIKNITLSAEEELIHLARVKALSEKKTLNSYFREWLSRFVGKNSNVDYSKLMQYLSHVQAGKHFTRDELNAR